MVVSPCFKTSFSLHALQDFNNNSSKSTQSNFSVFSISRSVDVLDLKADIFVLKNKRITLANI